jgi:hypothetical protein
MDNNTDFFVMKPMASFGVGGELRDFDASFGASYGPSSFRPSAEYRDGLPRFCLGRRDRVGRVLAWRDLFTAVANEIENRRFNPPVFLRSRLQIAAIKRMQIRTEPPSSKKPPPKEKSGSVVTSAARPTLSLPREAWGG